MTELSQNPLRYAELGTESYQAGFNSQAASLFERAAELAAERKSLRLRVYNLRWTGNALMWAGRYEEACRCLLHAISFDGHAEADLDDVYGAMTDLCLLSTRCRPYSALQALLIDARTFLARRGRERWGHRLDLIQAIAQIRRGEFTDAHQLASRAWQQVRTVHDGPRYHNNSYVFYLYRAAQGTGDGAAMDAALEQMQRYGEHSIQTCRVRDHLCRATRLAFNGLSDQNREQIDSATQEALGAMAASDSVGDEIIHVLRLLGMLGRWSEAIDRLSQVNNAEPAFRTLLRLDLAILELAAQAGWFPPFYMKYLFEANPPQPLANSIVEWSNLSELLERATSAAATEDTRMNCTFNSKAVALRRRWLLGEITGGGKASPPHLAAS